MRLMCKLGLHDWYSRSRQLERAKFSNRDMVIDTQECNDCPKLRVVKYPNVFRNRWMQGVHLLPEFSGDPDIPEAKKTSLKK